MEAVYVGIDVSLDKLDPSSSHVRELGGRYTGPGVERLVARLRELGPALIVLEATGGLERDLSPPSRR